MSNKIKRLYEFDDFRVDPEQKCLWRGDDLVSLTPKAFETLVVLLENKGRVVDKDTLLSRIWADTYVEEATLAQNISTLRRTLTIQANGKPFIETVPRRGYRFVGEVREILDDEEVYIVETRRQTRIVSQEEIHSSAEIASPEPKSKKKFLAAALIAGISVLAVGYFLLRPFLQPRAMSEKQFREYQVSRLTSSGNIHRMAISPDGKYLAMVEKRNGLSTLFLRQTGNARQVEVVPPTSNDFVGVTFSADNESIFYTTYQPVDENSQVKIGTLYRVPILGGPPTEILRDIDSNVAISPDGRKYAFIRNLLDEKESALIVVDSSDARPEEKKLTTRPLRNRFSEQGLAWSPDGRKIAGGAMNFTGNRRQMELVITDAASGEQTSLTREMWDWLGQMAWLADGSGIAVTSYGENSPNITDEIWVVSYPGGASRQITNGINGFFGLGITADGGSLVTVKSDRMTSLWLAPKDNLREAKMIRKNTIDGTLFKLGIDWTPDDKIVYSTAESGDADIWLMDADGTNPKQLTENETADYSPKVSPDGRFIVFSSNRSGSRTLWRMNADGSNPVNLSNLPYSSSPSISPDGHWVYFSAADQKTGRAVLWKISMGGGDAVQMTELPTMAPQISPDGKYLACFFPSGGAFSEQNRKMKLTLLAPENAAIVKQFDTLPGNNVFNWTPDSRAISYSDNSTGMANLWLLSIDGGAPQKLTDSETEDIFLHTWSKNGRNLIFVKESVNNNIVLINNLSK
jgi:Tol biopolymer transport system component/DNA-binding winged helix-turn-helix (wHTH) protein